MPCTVRELPGFAEMHGALRDALAEETRALGMLWLLMSRIVNPFHNVSQLVRARGCSGERTASAAEDRPGLCRALDALSATWHAFLSLLPADLQHDWLRREGTRPRQDGAPCSLIMVLFVGRRCSSRGPALLVVPQLHGTIRSTGITMTNLQVHKHRRCGCRLGALSIPFHTFATTGSSLYFPKLRIPQTPLLPPPFSSLSPRCPYSIPPSTLDGFACLLDGRTVGRHAGAAANSGRGGRRGCRAGCGVGCMVRR